MLFDVYGANAGFQWLGLFMVLGALILLNEFARRTKAGGIFMFIGVCAAMTVYCVVVEIGAAMGAEWALNNPTYQTMGGWFHYAKVYAASASLSHAPVHCSVVRRLPIPPAQRSAQATSRSTTTHTPPRANMVRSILRHASSNS